MSEKHYNIDYLEGTAERLKNLKEQSYAPLAAIQSGTIIELGCGTGFDAINIATLSRPGVEVIGIDHDPVMLEKARLSASGRSNIRFEEADATTLSYDTESIDAVRTERLVQHLPHPERTFEELHRVLKKDAPVVIVETDWENFTLYSGSAASRQLLGDYLVKDKIKNGRAAGNLITYLENNNFRDIKLQVFQFDVRSLNEVFAYLMIDQSLTEMRQKGILTEQAYLDFLAALQRADQGGYFSCTINLIIVTAIK